MWSFLSHEVELSSIEVAFEGPALILRLYAIPGDQFFAGLHVVLLEGDEAVEVGTAHDALNFRLQLVRDDVVFPQSRVLAAGPSEGPLVVRPSSAPLHNYIIRDAPTTKITQITTSPSSGTPRKKAGIGCVACTLGSFPLLWRTPRRGSGAGRAAAPSPVVDDSRSSNFPKLTYDGKCSAQANRYTLQLHQLTNQLREPKCNTYVNCQATT